MGRSIGGAYLAEPAQGSGPGVVLWHDDGAGLNALEQKVRRGSGEGPIR